MSTTHGRFQLSGSAVVFVDMGSTNGSFLNDVQLEQGVENALKVGDNLQIGSTLLLVKSVVGGTTAEDPAASAAAATGTGEEEEA